MRQLHPGVVEDRKRRLLQWVIHNYIKTSVPVASQMIAEEADMELSSASIRNLLQELESEGFLHQPHTSAGRVPTDKGYRFYVDYLVDVQRLAAEEKERIERQYRSRMDELDRLLAETSKLLSRASHSAGLVLSPRMEKQSLKHLEMVPLGGPQVLVVLVTQSGLIRHWPVKLSFSPTAGQVQRLNRFLNDNIQNMSVREMRTAVHARMEAAQRELHDLSALAESLLAEIDSADDSSAELYVEGATQILSRADELGDRDDIQSLIKMIEGKRALTRLLELEMENPKNTARVRIGRENALPELKHLSLVTTTYRVNDQVAGVLGILGSKRMEYSRMMGLLNHVSDIVSKALEHWGAESDEG